MTDVHFLLAPPTVGARGGSSSSWGDSDGPSRTHSGSSVRPTVFDANFYDRLARPSEASSVSMPSAVMDLCSLGQGNSNATLVLCKSGELQALSSRSALEHNKLLILWRRVLEVPDNSARSNSIVSPSPAEYWHVAFDTDTAQLYFTISPRDSGIFTLPLSALKIDTSKPSQETGPKVTLNSFLYAIPGLECAGLAVMPQYRLLLCCHTNRHFVGVYSTGTVQELDDDAFAQPGKTEIKRPNSPTTRHLANIYVPVPMQSLFVPFKVTVAPSDPNSNNTARRLVEIAVADSHNGIVYAFQLAVVNPTSHVGTAVQIQRRSVITAMAETGFPFGIIFDPFGRLIVVNSGDACLEIFACPEQWKPTDSSQSKNASWKSLWKSPGVFTTSNSGATGVAMACDAETGRPFIMVGMAGLEKSVIYYKSA